MEIDRAGGRLAEEIILYLRWPQLGARMQPLIPNEAAIFRLDPHDAVHRLPASSSGARRTSWILGSARASRAVAGGVDAGSSRSFPVRPAPTPPAAIAASH